MRRALAACPWPALADRVLSKYFLPKGRAPDQPYKRLPMWMANTPTSRQGIGMLAGFMEVWLAKAGHAGRVGVNLLTKVAIPNLPILYGAMHAQADVVLMGAGIPREIPGALDKLSLHEPAALRLDVIGALADDAARWLRFDPQSMGAGTDAALRRPAFFPIIAANSLATLMARKASGSIEGFVIEGPTAGGHNAPPRGQGRFDEEGQPIYGERDVVDLDAIAALGYPFWIAGGSGSPQGLASALAQGAAGIQVGTLFAYADESGMACGVKSQVLRAVRSRTVSVRTDPLASPTGFPFKVVDVQDTLSGDDVYQKRQRICDLGYLRDAYRGEGGAIHFRCASEPVEDFVRKGGSADDAAGRKCLCNGLMATAGIAQTQKDGSVEPAILTSGDAINDIRKILPQARDGYSALDVISYLTGPTG